MRTQELQLNEKKYLDNLRWRELQQKEPTFVRMQREYEQRNSVEIQQEYNIKKKQLKDTRPNVTMSLTELR